VRRFLFILLFLSCLSGCTATRVYNSLSEIPENDNLSGYSSISGVNSSILGKYFTEEAHKAVEHIPVIDGLMLKPYVVGVNIWSRLISVILFNGFERKVVVSRNFLGREATVRTFLHEYIHHLDDMDRDGEGEWIDHREFALAFHRLLQDSGYAEDVDHYLEVSDAFITNVFGVGAMSEIIAYIGGWVATNKCPNYMKLVYRKILK
jgi:hypothetical protein